MTSRGPQTISRNQISNKDELSKIEPSQTTYVYNSTQQVIILQTIIPLSLANGLPKKWPKRLSYHTQKATTLTKRINYRLNLFNFIFFSLSISSFHITHSISAIYVYG